MRILMIHQHFGYPAEGGAIRSYVLARFMLQAGHEVEIITRKNGLQKAKTVEIDGIKVHYLPVEYTNDMSFGKRIPAYLKFVVLAIKYFSRIRSQKFNLNYCISTPLTSGLIGLYLKSRYQLPFIFEVGDLWPDAPIQIKAIRFPLTIIFLKRLEKLIYNSARSIVGLSPVIVSTIQKRTYTTVDFVPNLSDNTFFQPSKTFNRSFTISYFGTLGRANELEYMLHAALACQQMKMPIQFNIMGDGARKFALIELARQLALKNVEFLPFGNRNSVKQLLNKTDAVYVSYKKLPVLETGSPNKFFDGLAAGKLMILNFGGWLADYVEDSNCGFSYYPENPKELVEKLKRYIENPEQLAAAQSNARKLAEEKFDLEHWRERFLEIISVK